VPFDANEIIERRACISGAGQSDIGRRLYRDPVELTIDGCVAAIADAGLTTNDIDGLSTYPGPMEVPPGFSGAGAYDMIDALRLNVGWYNGGLETSGQLGSVINACLAVASGLATHVLCFRSVWEGSAQGEKGRSAVMPGGGGGGRSFKASGFTEWTLPFSAPSAAVWIAMFAQRHFHQYGTTREQLAWIALNGRRNASLNPKAIYREPMTMDDYMAARMISSPFCLFDCDVPCDGATALIVSRVDRARDLRKPPLRVEAVGAAIHGRPSWDQFDDLSTMANRDAGAQLWTRTDLKPSDVQLLEAYDGFSFITMSWIEALGICKVGESGPFIEGGDRIGRDGVLPLNTHGGQLSAGRLHGYGFLHETAVQMWGEAGDRQVARVPEVAVAAAGGGNTCGCLLLMRDA
jgi:acetyl-CoA acetyltransferase